MPYNPDSPDPVIVARIKKRWPCATDKDVRQWVHVWNSTYERYGDEARAFACAWGVLEKRLDHE